MRTLLFAALTALTSSAFGQEPTSTDPPKPYERVELVRVDSTRTADQLYRSARRWFVDAFKDAEEVIQLEDDSARTIVGKGWFNYHDMGRIWFTVEVAAKAGRYRVRFYNFNHVGVGGLTSGTTYVPYLDYGPIYAGAECYTPKPTLMIVEGTEKEMMLIHCAGIIQPLIKKECDAMVADLQRAMSSAGSSDW
ncbi:MAG: DUF4468 domain-containing protein [Flavobacteriales bacterium]|nr:MAG: DUF4468 domain-containing protein [Flavobacteriales bacterium]